MSLVGRNSDVSAFVATTWQVPAEVEVRESTFVMEQFAAFELVTEKLTAPAPFPPVVPSFKSVKYVPESVEREKLDCAALFTVNCAEEV